MLSSGLRKVMKALLILLAAAGSRPMQTQLLRASVRRASPTSASDDAFALVLPEVNANTMDVFLDRSAGRAQNTHAIVLLDQAGRHGEKAFAVPVGGAIHSIKSVYVPLPHGLSRTHGGSRRIAL